MKTTTVTIFFNVNILVFSQFSRDFSHLTWVPWGVWTQPPGPHIGPYLLVSVTDGRISLLFDNFQKKSKITAPLCWWLEFGCVIDKWQWPYLPGRRGGASKEPSNSGRVRSLYCHVGSGKDCASDCKSESNVFLVILKVNVLVRVRIQMEVNILTEKSQVMHRLEWL